MFEQIYLSFEKSLKTWNMADEGKEHQADPQVHPALETKVCIYSHLIDLFEL